MADSGAAAGARATADGGAREPAFSLQAFPSTVAPARVRRVTAAAASEKLVLLGYADGAAALFDVAGNEVHAQPARHAAAVAAVALGDGAGAGDDVAASAAADGSVRVSPLFDRAAGDGGASLDARAGLRAKAALPITALAVDPEYGRPRVGERVAYAMEDGKVVLFQSGWFGGSESPVASPDGPVHAMCWTGFLLAWSTPLGVRIHDTRLGREVCFVESPMPVLRDPHTAPAGDATASEGVASDATGPPDGARSPSRPSGREIMIGDGASSYGGGTIGSGGVDSDAESVNPLSPSRSAAGSPSSPPPVLHHGPSAANAKVALHGPSYWDLNTSLMFAVNEGETPTKYGERTQTLYVSWPSVAKVVAIGPHVDPILEASTELDADAKSKRPSRTVETTLSLTRSSLPIDLGTATGVEALVSPLLSISPFGDHVALLIGTLKHGIVLARVSNDSGGLVSDVRCIRLPHNNVKGAQLCPIPGGDPIMLVVVRRHVWPDSDSSGDEVGVVGGRSGGIAAGALRSLEANQARNNQTGTELVSPRRESTGLEDDSAAKDGSCVLFARTLMVAERINWLLEHDEFAEALRIAEEAPRGSLRRADVSIADVGDRFLNSILSSGDYERLAYVLPRIIVSTSPTVAMRGKERVMDVRRKRWEEWIKKFKEAGRLSVVAKMIPCFEPQMRGEMYNDVLISLANTDPEAMLGVLRKWQTHVYDVALVTRAVEMKSAVLKDDSSGSDKVTADKKAVRQALYLLYAYSGRHKETLDLHLSEGSEEVFSYIKRNNLYDAVRSDEAIRDLYTIDEASATELLLDAPGTLLPPESIIRSLKAIGNRKWQCLYLYGFYQQDAERAAAYHGMLLDLLVEYGPPGALSEFLQTSTHFSLDAALKLMGGRKGRKAGNKFGRERVYVLSMMGRVDDAMDILLVELKDVHGAIEFASEHRDGNLWKRLIKHASGDANTLAALLDSPAGGKVDPVELIPLIDSNMDIPHLRDRLHRVLVDAALERALREETAAALHFDARVLMSELDDAVTKPTAANL